MEFGLYENKEAKVNSLLSVENYIGFVQFGNNQDDVILGRAAKQRGDEKEYRRIKDNTKAITSSCVFESGTNKTTENAKNLNGLICLDIDHEVDLTTYERIKADKHTFISHHSFGGVGYCVFVKINPEKFSDSFMGLAEYYHNTFNVQVDRSCSNPGRIRYVSFDEDIYHNDKSAKFIPKEVKKYKEPKIADYVFHQDDFDFILEQIRDRSIDLCREDYTTYMRIGMSIASHYGPGGFDKFKFICSFGSKYNEKNTIRDYNGMCRTSQGKMTIATFYHYVKEAGLKIYSEKTKTIINRVKVAKSQGKPTRESIASNLRVANDIIASDEDYKLIDALIASNRDFSKDANEDISEIEQLQNFIIDTFNPILDAISKTVSINGKRMGDREINDIYISCKKNFDFKVNVSDIRSILFSNSIPIHNALTKFFNDNWDVNCSGKMEEYARCIKPESDFNVWAFKKWLVGGVYNWISGNDWKEACPLTFVLTGQQQGTGKTSFFRNLLPKELEVYLTQTKIDSGKPDSMFRLTTSLILFDDEFGGEGSKNAKAYKSTSDTTFVTQRRPYAHTDDIFKRLALLCGTSNELELLMDATGNRRILPANVEYIDYPKIKSFDTVGLIMDAYNELKNGFDWVVRTQEDIQYIKDNTDQNESISPVEEIFFNNFSTSANYIFDKEVIFNQGEIMEYITNNSPIKPTKYEIKELLTKNKISYQAHRIGQNIKKGNKLYIKSLIVPEIK